MSGFKSILPQVQFLGAPFRAPGSLNFHCQKRRVELELGRRDIYTVITCLGLAHNWSTVGLKVQGRLQSQG